MGAQFIRPRGSGKALPIIGRYFNLWMVIDKLGNVFDEKGMSTTYRSKLISQQAYARRVLRKRHRAEMGGVKMAGCTMKEGTEAVYEIIRHSVMMVGILGLVAIAVGATTECIYYHRILNWVSSFFIS